MNPDTDALVLDVAGRRERAARSRDCPAIVGLRGNRPRTMSDHDHLGNADTAEAFELRTAREARDIEASAWVFTVPLVLAVNDAGIASRPVSNLLLRAHENAPGRIMLHAFLGDDM